MRSLDILPEEPSQHSQMPFSIRITKMGWRKGNSPQQRSPQPKPHSCNIPLFSMKTKETVQHLSA